MSSSDTTHYSQRAKWNTDHLAVTKGRIPRIDANDNVPVKRSLPKVRRNDPCVCGSGLKFKKCCIRVHDLIEKHYQEIDNS